MFSMQPNSVRLFQFVIPEILNVSEFPNELNLLIYPNPTNGIIEIKNKQIIGKIVITDITGKIIKTAESNKNSISTDLTSYSSGIYIVHFSKTNKKIKLIKK